jgi:hypothetical protein
MRLSVSTCVIAIFAACFAILGMLVVPKAHADEHVENTRQTFSPRVQVPAMTAPYARSVSGQEGQIHQTAASSTGRRLPHNTVPLGSVAAGGLLGLAATFGLRRFAAINSSRKDSHYRKYVQPLD